MTMTTEELEKKVRNYGKKAKALQIKILEDAGVYDEELHTEPKNHKETYSKLLTGEVGTNAQVEPVASNDGDELVDNTGTTDTTSMLDSMEPIGTVEIADETDEGMSLTVDTSEVVQPKVVNIPPNKDKLAELAEEILLNRKEELYVPEDTPKPKDRRVSKYQIGLALREARSMFPSDKEFGEWVQTEINDELLANEQKIINQKTLYNYRQLAEFGTFEACEDVGFTNVYKLMQEGNEDKLAHIQSLIAGETMYEETGAPATGKEISLSVKEILGQTSKPKLTQDQIDDMLAGMIDEEEVFEMQQKAEDEAQKRIYMQYLGIEADELSLDTIKVTHRAAMVRFHPDKHGSAYINDFNFSNVAAEFLKGCL